MSRRIATAYVLAACAVIATPAFADRECFDSSCRMPDVTDAPTEVVEAPSTAVTPSPDIDTPPAIVEEPRADAAPAPVTKPPAAVPVRELPRIADPTTSPAVPPIHRYEQGPPAPRHQPPRYAEPKTQRPKAPIPSYADDDYTRRPRPQVPSAAPAPRYAGDGYGGRPRSHVPAPAPSYVAEQPGERIVVVHQTPRVVEAPSSPVYVVNQGPTHGSGYASAGVTVVGTMPVYGGGAAIAVYPQMRPDPAWKHCQIDAPGNSACVPYSYHPYGAKGYRPMGTYKPYRPAQAYVYAPDARIISVEGYD